MKKSNKILILFASVVSVIYLLLLLNFKPEYRKSALRNIQEKFKVVSIEDDVIAANNVLFTNAASKEETGIYYEQDGFQKFPWYREVKDTLILIQPKYEQDYFDNGKKLHINLKGVDEVLLRGEVIYKK